MHPVEHTANGRVHRHRDGVVLDPSFLVPQDAPDARLNVQLCQSVDAGTMKRNRSTQYCGNSQEILAPGRGDIGLSEHSINQIRERALSSRRCAHPVNSTASVHGSPINCHLATLHPWNLSSQNGICTSKFDGRCPAKPLAPKRDRLQREATPTSSVNAAFGARARSLSDGTKSFS